MKTQVALISAAALLTGGFAQTQHNPSEGTYSQKKFVGFVPDPTTACGIAKVILPKMLGGKTTEGFIYKAELVGKEWKVTVDKRHTLENKSGGSTDVMNDDLSPILMINRYNGSMSFRPF